MDVLAELILPLTGALWLIAAVRAGRSRACATLAAGTVASLALVYGVAGLDRAFGLWPGVGLDYSTHTAFGLGLALPLAILDTRWLWACLPLLIAYALLMIELDYHSLGDILSTALVVAPPVVALQWLLRARIGPVPAGPASDT